MTDLYAELLELINQQGQVISKQNETIVKLVNITAEQENVINVMMREQIYQ